MITLNLTSKSFGATTILRDINLTVAKGETVALANPMILEGQDPQNLQHY